MTEEVCSTCGKKHNPVCSNSYHLERLKKLGYDLDNLPEHAYSLFEVVNEMDEKIS
jgi:hypothetical protein